jgi:hypothetical protein
VRIVALALAALAVTGCMGRSSSSGSSRAATPGLTRLTISVSPGKGDGVTRTWTLTCPDGGTLPSPRAACEQLARLDDPFAPVPKDVACTEVYGGPQVAEVRGRFLGRPVSAHFSRTDGCEIARWDRVGFLFPDT